MYDALSWATFYWFLFSRQLPAESKYFCFQLIELAVLARVYCSQSLRKREVAKIEKMKYTEIIHEPQTRSKT